MLKPNCLVATIVLPLFLAGPPLAVAEEMTPMVAVPDYSKNGFVGCYDIQGTLYGPYRMSFCLKRANGTYQVKGGSLNCVGDLDWYDMGKGRLEIDLYRSKCGGGMSWTGDSLQCRSTWKPLLKGTGDAGAQVAVPSGGGGPKTLNCLYQPVAGGYKPKKVVAKRT